MSDCPAVGWSPDEDPATDNPWVCVREAGHEGRHSTGLARDADGDEDEDEPVRWSDGSSNLMAERDALAAQVEALTAQRDEAVRLLRAMDDGEPCAPDHYLTCQAHSGGNPCEVAEARTFLNGVDE